MSLIHILRPNLVAIPFDGERHVVNCDAPYCCEWATQRPMDVNPFYSDEWLGVYCDQHAEKYEQMTWDQLGDKYAEFFRDIKEPATGDSDQPPPEGGP